jgi:hypothetical protein
MGTYVRSLLGRVPWVDALDLALARVKNLDAPETHLRGGEISSDDLPLLGLLESKVRVTPHIVPTWAPPVGFEAAMERMATWLRESYSVRTALGWPRNPDFILPRLSRQGPGLSPRLRAAYRQATPPATLNVVSSG